jgi:carbon starvation protein CstA
MIRRLLIIGLGTSIVQIALYLLLLYAGSSVSGILDKPRHRGVDWGLTIYFSCILFTIVVLLLNVVTALVNRRWVTWAAISLTSLSYVLGWAEDFGRYPYRTVYLLLIGWFCLIAKLFIDKRLEQLSSTTTPTIKRGRRKAP